MTTCDCMRGSRGEDGFTLRSDGVWVHAKCRRPTTAYLRGFLDRMPATHLNLFRSGPLHNLFLSNTEMIDRASIDIRPDAKELHDHLAEYRWTTETLTGESGKIARIWVWQEPAPVVPVKKAPKLLPR